MIQPFLPSAAALTAPRLVVIWLFGLPCLLGSAEAGRAQSFGNFVEMRVYTTKPEVRDRFLHYFEEHYLESQEVLGMRIWGQFRDLDEPSHFVWVRGFTSMEERLDGLRTFYTSPMWRETGQEVGSMLAARGRVRLLEPVDKSWRFDPKWRRAPLLSEAGERDLGVVAVLELGPPLESPDSSGDSSTDDDGGGSRDSIDLDAVVQSVETHWRPVAEASGGASLGLFRTSQEENDFPALPVTEVDDAVVWFVSFASREELSSFLVRRKVGSPPLDPRRVWVLEPGERSRLFNREG